MGCLLLLFFGLLLAEVDEHGQEDADDEQNDDANFAFHK
jgi:hypothetical protein